MSARAETAVVQVPGWLLDSASPRALQVAALLGRLAAGSGHVEVSRRTLAGQARCSLKIVDASLAELEETGFLTRQARRDGTGQRVPNRYRLRP